jgi:curved DNA-binding protein CbpA
MMKHFNDITTVLELKAEYYRLAKKFHPDTGGNSEDFVNLKAEYEQKLEKLTSKQNLLKSIIQKSINSPIFDTYILPLLLQSQENIAKNLPKSKKVELLINYFAKDEDEKEFYTEIFKNQIQNFDIKDFLRKISE